MQATLIDTDGNEAGSVELPAAFEAPYRPDLIRRAVLAAQANAKQPYGADAFAGKRTSAESLGSGRGMAHVPRSGGRGRRVPQTVGGRRAHPPKAEADHGQKINDKERQQAVRSAIAATADPELVAARGHRFPEGLELPLVVEDGFEGLEKTREVADLLEALELYADVERAEDASVRAGRGTTRGRKRRRAASVLFVTGGEPSRAARNLAGATVATGREVSAEDLAPGGHAGRLTLWTEHALEEVAER